MQKEFDAIFYDLGGTLRLVQRDEAFEARAPPPRIAELCGETGDPTRSAIPRLPLRGLPQMVL